MFLDLLQEAELRDLLAGGGATCVEHLRSSASYLSPLQESDMHVEVRKELWCHSFLLRFILNALLLLQMFWTTLEDFPRTSLIRLLQSLCGSSGSGSRTGGESGEEGVPEELHYWRSTTAALGVIIIVDTPHSSITLTKEEINAQLIHLTPERALCLPRYSGMEVMRAQLKFFIEGL